MIGDRIRNLGNKRIDQIWAAVASCFGIIFLRARGTVLTVVFVYCSSFVHAVLGGAVVLESGPDYVLDDFESKLPRYKEKRRSGRPLVYLERRDRGSKFGSGSLFVKVSPTPATGKNESGIIWSFKRSQDYSEFDQIQFWYRAHQNDYRDFVIVLKEESGAGYMAKAKPTPNIAGSWQLIRLNLADFSWYHETRHDADNQLDLAKIKSIRIRLWGNIEKSYSFDIDQIGFSKKLPEYSGPLLEIVPEHKSDYIVYRPKSIKFTAKLSNLASAAGKELKIVVKTFDYFDRLLESKDIANELLKQQTRFDFEAEDKRLNYLKVEGTVYLEGREIYQAGAELIVLSRKMKSTDFSSASLFGSWVGGGHIRLGLSWNRAYTRGSNAYKYNNKIMFKRTAGSVRDAGSLHYFVYTPRWLVGDSTKKSAKKLPPNDWVGYGDYIKEATKLTRRNGYTHYELWNEPDSYSYWRGSLDEFILLAETTYKAIKAIQPNATVLGPTTYSFNLDYLEEFFQRGGRHWIDDVAVHGYTPAPPDVHFVDGLNNLRLLMKKYDLGERDVYISEMGYSTPKVTESEQARYLVRAFIYAIAADVKVMIWHMLNQLDSRPDPGYALLRNNGSPRKAYLAYAVLIRALAQSKFVSASYGSVDGQRIFKFDNQGTTTLVAWDYINNVSCLRLEGATDKVESFDITGYPGANKTNQGTPHIFALSVDPIYIRYKNSSMKLTTYRPEDQGVSSINRLSCVPGPELNRR